MNNAPVSYILFVFFLRMTLKIAWSEAVLSIIHSLLDSKVTHMFIPGKELQDQLVIILTVIEMLFCPPPPPQPVLTEEVFTQFTEHLVAQAPRFTKSVKFAKMMLTVLTKYSSHVSLRILPADNISVCGWRNAWRASAYKWLFCRWTLHTNSPCPAAWCLMRPSWRSLFKLLWSESQTPDVCSGLIPVNKP